MLNLSQVIQCMLDKCHTHGAKANPTLERGWGSQREKEREEGARERKGGRERENMDN